MSPKKGRRGSISIKEVGTTIKVYHHSRECVFKTFERISLGSKETRLWLTKQGHPTNWILRLGTM